MADDHSIPKFEEAPAISFASLLRKIPAFSTVTDEDLQQLGQVGVIHAPANSDIFEVSGTEVSGTLRAFWIVLEGEIRLQIREPQGRVIPVLTAGPGESFGEVPLLMGVEPKAVSTALVPSRLIYLTDQAFWILMSHCPSVRAYVLANMARRWQFYQSQAMHREKLISLGTLAAGLMHELNNPGSAARRAASQMRENLVRLQQISLRMCGGVLTPQQKECLRALQEQALSTRKPKALSSLEQSDAEEKLADWMEEQGIADAWKLSGTFTGIGFDVEGLQCAAQVFPKGGLSDPLNWMEALISSVNLVGTIEESVSRVTDLVHAVKTYAYEDKSQRHEIDIHESLQSTLVILGHKFREKELTVEKRFAAAIPPVTTCGIGLNQIWTNLLDNAIDAAPQRGHIVIRTWAAEQGICVGIADDGPGISEEDRSHIFEPFFTTKPVGEGTGLGLDIVQRIVVGQFMGKIQVDSAPGKTEFTVMIPLSS